MAVKDAAHTGATSGPACSTRFARKREDILDAATVLLNRRGVRGMTLAEVAASVGLSTTSVTYYFKKKEDLAVACLARGIAWFEALTDQAFAIADEPEGQLKAFIDLYLGGHARMRQGTIPPVAVFNDVRALKEPHQSLIAESYNRLFRKVRRLFAGPALGLPRNAANARTHALMEQVFWSMAWLPRYPLEDYPRLAARMTDILIFGIAQPSARFVQSPLSIPVIPVSDEGRETFLTAATAQINLHGYRGASVEKIAAHLHRTKGAFYHHNEAKDDLVAACFARSFAIIRQAQSQAMAMPVCGWGRLSAVTAQLCTIAAQGVLLRGAALSALPEPVRHDMTFEWSRVTDRFAAMLSDAAGDGAIRGVDTTLAARMLSATISAATAMDQAVPGAAPNEAPALYAGPFLMGLFTR